MHAPPSYLFPTGYAAAPIEPAVGPSHDPQQVLLTLPRRKPRGIGRVELLPLKGVSPYHGAGQRPIYHAPGWRGIGDRRRIAFLRNMAEEHGSDPRMREFVVNQVLRPAGVAERDYPGQAAAILRWNQERIYYTNEPGEQIQIPWITLEWKTGDCDDKAVLLAAMAHSLAMPWRYALAGKDRRTGQAIRWVEPWGGAKTKQRAPPSQVDWSHIYVVLGWPPFRPEQWASAEPTLPPDQAPLGYDVVEHGAPGSSGRASMPELAGWGVAATALRRRAEECGVCTCPGDEEAAEDDRPFLRRVIEDMEWSLIVRDTFVAVLSTLTIGLLLRERRR